ncbi:hypothetical protein KL935_001656 [Ogataea polymorpha]|nr:hypothetical protein KL935_001656 [Ogataea polymorpha]KAG7911264.1 hypothetical protein KL906_000585 [Ogataea polymorpha]KAG7919518.1 hypothetical protein KL927_001647 [Ogataea polymorpha]
MEINSEATKPAQGYMNRQEYIVIKWLDYVVINLGSQVVIYDMNLKPVRKLVIHDVNMCHVCVIERYLLVIVDCGGEFLTIMLTWNNERFEIAYCAHNLEKRNYCYQYGQKSFIDGVISGFTIVHNQPKLYRVYVNACKVIFQPYEDDGVLRLGPDFFSQSQRNVLVMYAVHCRTLCLPWVHRQAENLVEEVITCSNGFDSRFYKLSNSNSQIFGLARSQDGNIRKIIPIGNRYLLIVSQKVRVVLRSSACNKYRTLGYDEGLEIYCSNGSIPDILFIQEGHAIICDPNKGIYLLKYTVRKHDFEYKLKLVSEYIKPRQMLRLRNHRYLAISSSNIFLLKFSKGWKLEVLRIFREQFFVRVTDLLIDSKATKISSANRTADFVEVLQDDSNNVTSIKLRSKLRVKQIIIPVYESFCEIYPINVYHLFARCLDGYLYELTLKEDTAIIKKCPINIKELGDVIGVAANVLVTTKCAALVATHKVFTTFKGTALSCKFTNSYGVVFTSSMIYIFMLQPEPHVIHQLECITAHASIYESDNRDLSIICKVHGVLHHFKINRAYMTHVRSGIGHADTQDLVLLNNNVFASLTSCGTLHFKELSTFDDDLMIRLQKSCSKVWRISDSSFAAFSPLRTSVYLMSGKSVESYFIQNTEDALNFQVIGNSLYHLRNSELVISTIIPNLFSENVYHHLGPMYNIQIVTIQQSHYLIYNDYERVYLYDLNLKDSLDSIDMPNIQHIYSYKGLKFGDKSINDSCLILLVAEVNELFDASKCMLELVALKVSHDLSLQELFSIQPKYSDWSCLDWYQLREALETRSDHQLQMQTIPGSWVISGKGRS